MEYCSIWLILCKFY